MSLDQPVIDLTNAIERYRSDGDLVQISTAAGKDGIKRRIVVKARDAGARPDWIAFALTNDTDEQIERILIAPHFRLVGSGVIWPDLGGSRIAAITASQGIRPERDENPDADQFTITLDPGTTVTYVAELRNATVPQLHLWDQDAYRRKTSGLTLYKGIIIGISGLLALFLTIVFVVKGAIIFPAAAALAWSVLAYACIDFGFLQRVFPVTELAERSTGRRPRLCSGRRSSSSSSPTSTSPAGTCATATSPSSGWPSSPASSGSRCSTRPWRRAWRASPSRRWPGSACC